MIKLLEITRENHLDVRELKVHSSQQKFVATIDKSLADAYVWKKAVPRVAVDDGIPVGFVMIFPFADGGLQFVIIVRLLVDCRFQQKGLGRQLVEVTIDWINSLSPKVNRIRISTLPENTIALNLYRSCGFTGYDIEDGEIALYQETSA